MTQIGSSRSNIGVLLMGGGIFALTIGFIVGIFMLINWSFTSSDAYIEAMRRVRANSTLVLEMGTPIQSGWFISGSMETSGMSGNIDLTVPISGPKKSGTLYIGGRMENGEWSYYTLGVVLDGRKEMIDLRSNR